ncbi:serine hydrolase domain-containing protein [Massilia litorea]|jgi:CubicO group peptidase (beta-lactamase class C family)|uniref:Beta-lactamase family protein n=1 Tax=Massilia litorea TaxID=2769491 RepID=A0A7L9U917_9BURK|nr:serine hydrolase domain-containing protein [Massilia litorea]QOL50752.1 beta-lactamase family protein [Massilia litorea]
MNEHRRTVLGLALLGACEPLLAAVPVKGGRTSAHTLDDELRAIVRDPACELASLSVLAIRHGKLAYEGQFGRRRIGNGEMPDLPANRDTLYRIASISKMMTTLGLMRLVEQNNVELDADVSHYLGFTLRNPHFPQQAITLRHLLTHRSSLRDDAGYSFPAGSALREFVKPGASLHGEGKMWASNAGPGEYFTYCNLGWGLIGTLMEGITGERFDRLMQRLLLQPLGLQAGYNPAELPPPALANLATLYRKRTLDPEIWDANGPWIAQADDYHARAPAPPPGIERYVIGENATPFSPTGGLRISARDMGTVMLMLMNGGVHAGRRILRKATLQAMFTRQWTADGKGSNGDTLNGLFNCWGLGNAQFPDQPGRRLVEGGFDAVGHLGDAYGLRSVFAFDPARRNGMIVLVGGTSSDPGLQPGDYSALARFEERILTSTFRHAIAG